MTAKKNDTISREMQEKYVEITVITDEFCHTYLNEEYKELSRKMTTELSRKKNFPLQSGRAQS